MTPLWCNPAFLDLCCRESFSLQPSQLGTSGSDATGYPWALSLVSEICSRLLEEGNSKDNQNLLPLRLKHALLRIRILFSSAPTWDSGSWSRLISLTRLHSSQIVDQLAAIVCETVGRVKCLQPGGFLIIPSGFRVDLEHPPIFYLFVIHRPEFRAQFLELAVVNASGFGTEYHAFRLDSVNCIGGVERDLLLVLQDVIPERISHSSFWTSVYRLLLRPAPTNVSTLYNILLTHTNCRPLFSNWITSSSSSSSPNTLNVSTLKRGGAWYPAPALRTAGSCLPGAFACFHYVSQTLRSNEDTATDNINYATAMMWLWWAVCLHCKENAFQKHISLKPFHITLLRSAIKHFASLVSQQSCLQADTVSMYSNEERALTTLPSTQPSLPQTAPNEAFFINSTNLTSFKTLLDNFEQSLTAHAALHSMKLTVRQGDATFHKTLGSPNFGVPAMHAMFPMFGKFRKDLAPDFDNIAGTQEHPPLRIPVDLASVIIPVETLQDVCTVMRNCLNTVTILGNQRNLISNTYSLRVQLIQHIILEVLPLPLPVVSKIKHRSKCFWQGQSLGRELQTELLRILHGLARHYVTACFSLRNCRNTDAARVIVMAAMCTFADVILRLPTENSPNPLAVHYSGLVEGPTFPFAFDITTFAKQSEFFLLTDPVLNTARGQILDYFTTLNENIPTDHIILSFDTRMDLSPGDISLLQQISLQYAFPSSLDNLRLYFTGDAVELADFIPDWIYLRDIVFYFKALMVPDATDLPPIKSWSVSDATLSWTYQTAKNQLGVRAFSMSLEGITFIKDDYYDKQRGMGELALSKFLGWIGLAPKRVPPSAADPTNLVPNHERLETEDDVLHLKKLPDFGGRLSGQDSEVLLQYLTAPYIRIPLILQFFSDETRIDSLVCSELQQVVMAAAFEPSMWQKKRFKETPEEIPPKQRDVLSTPLGLLFNELTFASDLMLESLEEMLDIAIDKDTGHPGGHSATLLLFVIRLTVYVCRYISFLINHERYWDTTAHDNAKYQKISRCGYASLARGLTLHQHEILTKLENVHQRIKKRLLNDVLPLLEDWAAKALRKSDLVIACKIYAHITIILADLDPHDYTSKNVGYLLAALLFVFTHHKFTIESTVHRFGHHNNAANIEDDASTAIDFTTSVRQNVTVTAAEYEGGGVLGVPEMEIFTVLQKHRTPLLHWFRNNPDASNEIMEFTIQLVSFTGRTQGKNANSSIGKEDLLFPQGQLLPSRNWIELPFFCGSGRFVTATEAENMKSIAEQLQMCAENVRKKRVGSSSVASFWDTSLANSLKKMAGITLKTVGAGKLGNTEDQELIGFYELWLRGITRRTTDTEINLQTADFSVCDNPMELLDDWVNEFNDFVNLFGPVSPTSTFQCAVVAATTHRYWCRLIGRRHDLQRWQRNPHYYAQPEFLRPCNAATLRPDEAWVAPILEPWLAEHMPGAQLFIDDSSMFSLSLESSVHSNPASPSSQEPPIMPIPSIRSNRKVPPKPFVRLQCVWPPKRASESTTNNNFCFGIKEIVVTLFPRTIEVFDIVEEGRQHYTRLCYTSDMHNSFGSFTSSFSQHHQPVIDVFAETPIRHYYDDDDDDFHHGAFTSLTTASTLERVSLASSLPPSKPQLPANATLVISRCLSESIGPQRFVPSRQLHGLIPACLLHQYEFWQNLDECGTLHGYCRESLIKSTPTAAGIGKGSTILPTTLKISIIPTGPLSRNNNTSTSKNGIASVKTGEGVAIIRRYTIQKLISSPSTSSTTDDAGVCSSLTMKTEKKRHTETDVVLASEIVQALETEIAVQVTSLKEEDISTQEDSANNLTLKTSLTSDIYTLLDLKHVALDSDLAALRDCLTRIEDLGHILVWTSAPIPDADTKFSDAASLAKSNLSESPWRKKVPISLIELPRLGLSFRDTTLPKTHEQQKKQQQQCRDRVSSPGGVSSMTTHQQTSNGHSATTTRMNFRCDQHAGLYLSTRKISPDSFTARLVHGISNSLILENEDGDIYLMTDAIGKPILVNTTALKSTYAPSASHSGSGAKNTSSTTAIPGHSLPTHSMLSPEAAAERYVINQLTPPLLFDRNDERWIRNLGDSRHYLYTVHSSRSYLFAPTSASALYLLLLRFLDRQYEEVCKSADAAHFFDSHAGLEEEQIWRILNSLDATRDSHPDAHACRIKIWLAASGQLQLSSHNKSNTTTAYYTQRLMKEMEKVSSRATQLATTVAGAVKKREASSHSTGPHHTASSSISGASSHERSASVSSACGPSGPSNTQPDVSVGMCLWDVQLDVIQYCRKLQYVSGGCRLTPEEELEALRYFPSLVQSSPSLHNRQIILQSILERKRSKQDDQKPFITTGLHIPSLPHVDNFDALVDRTAVETATAVDAITNIVGSISVFKRNTEDNVVGSEALGFFYKSLDRSFKLFNEWHFFYELLTNGCPISVIPGESTYLWGALFCRFLGTWDTSNQGQLMSILRILMHNPQLSTLMPRLKDDRKHKLPLGIMMRSQETFQKFFKEVQTVLKAKEDHKELQWPIPIRCSEHFKKVLTSISMKPQCDISNRWAVGPRISDTSCSERQLCEVSAVPYLPLVGIDISSPNFDRNRFVGIPDVTNTAIKSFASQPLSQHLKLSSVIIYMSREEMRQAAATSPTDSEKNEHDSFLLNTVAGELPFVLGHHASAATPLGRSTLKRLQTEIKAYSERVNSERIPQLTFLKSSDLCYILGSFEKLKAAIGLLQQLKDVLATSFVRDGRFVDFAIRLTLKMANFPPSPKEHLQEDVTYLRQWSFIFGKFSGHEPAITFDVLVSLLLCPSAELELRRLNPYIAESVRQDILSLTAAVLFVVNRRGQLCRALHSAVALETALLAVLQGLRQSSGTNESPVTPKPPSESTVVKIRLLASALTTCLDTRREYATLNEKMDMNGKSLLNATFDPRFLVFEFAYNIILRKSQIELIHKFMRRVAERGSLCHQAIMGAGKTTVVAPLLTLLLADGSDLVVQVVPHTLLEFTRTVMQERFSAVIKKGVLTFSFSRYQSVTPPMFSALIQAKEKKAVVLATPTSIKSVFLKVLQLFHILDTSAREMTSVDRVWHTGQTQFTKLRNAMGKMLKLPVLGTDDALIDTAQLSGKLTDEQFRAVRRELDLTLRTLNLFKSSVLLLDEVDLLLHPLKSELHWPIGSKRHLDFTRPSITGHHTLDEDPELETGLRWKIPWHIIDAFFYVQQTSGSRRLSVPFGNSREAWNILEDFKKEIRRGLSDRSIQRTPHFVLLDEYYYHSKLKTHLARWTHLGLRAFRFQGLGVDSVLRFLCLPLYATADDNLLAAELLGSVEHLHDTHIKMLNHARNWLNSFLPHILQKVNRVGFGIMTPAEVAQQLIANPSMPPSRLLLAVPFIGKDSPSLTSEFAHPDIIIGLSILAYRYDGLRAADFTNVLTDQLQRLAEGFGPIRDRPAALEFIEWVEAAGGRVRGSLRRSKLSWKTSTTIPGERKSYVFKFSPTIAATTADTTIDAILNDSILEAPQQAAATTTDWFAELLSSNSISTGTVSQRHIDNASNSPRDNSSLMDFSHLRSPQKATTDNCELSDMMFQRIWPLELINPSAPEQIELLYRLLWKEPLVIRALLFNVVFPLTLQHASQQLSASGQELGGSIMFPIRLGFSGTPSELLPLELGSAEFEAGTDGQFIHYLSSPEIASIEILENQWNVNKLLHLVASRTDINAFIDSGALVTGKSNFDVARVLLQTGLIHVDGVIYLDEDDRQMVLLRDGWKIIKIAQCGLPLERRFTFYDQVHTTGQDIKQAPTAKALITIGKDMTFRDFAQGSWRMRGIGLGQRLTILMPPEVADLVERNSRQSRTLGISERLFGRIAPNTVIIPVPNPKRDLAEICAWLVIRGIQSESIQLRLLTQHNLFNIWRKNAFAHLCLAHSEIGTSPSTGQLFECLQLFKERLEFFVSASPPQYEMLANKLISVAEAHSKFLKSKDDVTSVEHVLKVLLAHDEAVAGAAGQSDSEARQAEAVEAEVTHEQEQEQEEEEEEEQEQEQEKEQEQQKEQEQEPEAAANYKYSRSDEAPQSWKLTTLCCPPDGHPVFYPLSEFGVLRRLTEQPKTLCFPPYLWVSGNHFAKKWSLKTFRRLKNVLLVMEWIPNTSEMQHTRTPAGRLQHMTNSIPRKRLQKAFNMLDMSGSGSLPVIALRELLTVLEIGCERAEDWNDFENKILGFIHQRRRSPISELTKKQCGTDTTSIDVRHHRSYQEQLHDTSTEGLASLDDLLMAPSKPTPKLITGGRDIMRSSVPAVGASKTLDKLGTIPLAKSSDLLLELDSAMNFASSHKDASTDLLGVLTSPNALPATSSSPSPLPNTTVNGDLLNLGGNDSVSELQGVATTTKQQGPLFPDITTVSFSELAEALDALGALDESTSASRRHFVLLSLDEAEGLRAAMHIAQLRGAISAVPSAEGSRVAIALRHVTAKFALLDISRYFASEEQKAVLAHGTLQQAAHACFRYLNSELQYPERQVAMLLRTLHLNSCALREEFFNNVRKCRRRPHTVDYSASLTRVFRTPDDVALVQLHAAGARMRRILNIKGLSLSDGFHAFDIERKGQLQTIHVYAGIKWLGIPLSVEEFQVIWNHIPNDTDGYITEADFVRAFGSRLQITDINNDNKNINLLENDKPAATSTSLLKPPCLALTKMPRLTSVNDVLTSDEIHALLSVHASGSPINTSLNTLDPKIYQRFKFKLQSHTAFKKVWEGTLAVPTARVVQNAPSTGTSVSFWAPEQLEGKHRSFTRKNRERVCLGHYVCPGFSISKYFDGKQKPSYMPMVLEVEDSKASTIVESPELRKALDVLMPHPVRFKLLWRDSRSCSPVAPFQSLTIWKPIPPIPSLFTALGYCINDGEHPPPTTNIRCIPIKWTDPLRYNPNLMTILWTSVMHKETDRPISMAIGNTLHQFIMTLVSPNQRILDLKAPIFQLEPEPLERVATFELKGSQRDEGISSHLKQHTNSEGDLLSGDSAVSTAVTEETSDKRIPRFVAKKAKGWF